MEREVVSEVKKKWRPGGICLRPWKVREGGVVKVRRSMPQRKEGGRLRRRRVCEGVGAARAILRGEDEEKI